METILELENIRKEFGEVVAIDGIDLSVKAGDFFCLLGPSGSGKTTLLRIIGGLEDPQEGVVRMFGKDITDVPPEDRNTSTVFQNWVLFPNMSVFDNVAFGMEMKNLSKSKIEERVSGLLDLVNLSGYETRMPSELSGGEMQRVALARALAPDPELLLMDEPLSNLDKALREKMRIELLDLYERLEKTIIYVTHNQKEALTLAKTLALLKEGKLIESGPKRELYEKPKRKYTGTFLGGLCSFPGFISSSGSTRILKTNFGSKIELENGENVPESGEVEVAVRPENITTDKSSDIRIRGKAKTVLYEGNRARIEVETKNGENFTIYEPKETRRKEGETVHFGFDKEDILIFPPGE